MGRWADEMKQALKYAQPLSVPGLSSSKRTVAVPGCGYESGARKRASRYRFAA